MTTPSYENMLSDIITRAAPSVLNNLTNTDAPFYAAAKKENVQEKVYQLRLKAGENRSTAFIADGGALPTARNVDYKTANISGKTIISRLTLDRVASSQGKGKEKKTINMVKEQVDSCMKGMLRQLDVALIVGSGNFGAIGSAAATDIGASSNRGNLSTSTPLFVETDIAFSVRPGQTLDLYAASSGSPTGNILARLYVTKVTIDFDTGAHGIYVLDTGDYTPNFTSAATDLLVMHGAYAATSAQSTETYATNGLLDVVGSGSLHGLSDTDIANWSANRVDSSGTLDDSHFRRLKTLSSRRGGNGRMNCAWVMTSDRQMETYEIEIGKIRFGSTKVMIGDHESMDEILSYPVIVDESHPNDSVSLANMDDIKVLVFQEIFTEGEGAVAVDKGRMNFRPSSTTLTYEAEFWGTFNLAAEARHRSGSIHSLT